MIASILENIRAETNPILLMGDVNFDRLTDNPENQHFEEELLSHGIIRLPLPETRTTNTCKSSIDCICTNMPNSTVKFNIFQTGLSDHTGQQCLLHLESKIPQTSVSEHRRNFSKQNLQNLKTDLMKVDWSYVYNEPDAEEMYNAFYRNVRLNLDLTCPNKKSRTKKRSKQNGKYDEEARRLKEDFLRAFRKYEVTGNAVDKAEMITKKKDYDLKLRNLKRTAATEYINKSDNKSKALWTIINSEKQAKNPSVTPLQMEINGTFENNPSLIAENLNKFFAEVAENTLIKNRNDLHYVPQSIQNPPIRQYIEVFNFAPTNEKEVLEIISSLKSKLSCGLDEVPSKAVKHCAEQLAAPLAAVINKSFEQGHFPSLLKLSKIYPKHKTGTTTKLENYRPISLISTFSKIIEKIAIKRMTEHLQNQELLTKHQHGFLKGRSTLSALVSLVEFVTDQLEDNKLVAAVMVDYSKAFDCLGHDLILTKLATLGVRGRSGNWIASYLEGRQQLVELQTTTNGKKTSFKSTFQPSNRGVPQGSVLGPFLFVLFTNDFPNSINYNSVMYADDTTLLLTTSTAEELHSDIISSTQETLHYCLQNDLVINPKKTTCINFSRRLDEIPKIPDLLVEKEAKLLGVTIDSDLSWTTHVNNLSKKLASGVFVVRRMKWIGGLDIAKAAYYALIESHIRYGLTVWGGTTKQNLNRILVLQKKAIRTLADLKPTESCRESFKALGILTVISLYIHTVVTHTHQQDYRRGKNIHHYNTRRAKDYILPLHHTTQYSKKPSYIGRKLYNALPESLKNLNTQQLKRQLQDWLVERPLYTLEEFFTMTQTY
uniref:Reverse transcriptase domain-containing protein n=2 Tax=Graphocephala atropunctata TaxID=36148 RepID=A0A1B6KGZ5_9HEMI